MNKETVLPLGHLRAQVGDENSGRFVSRVTCPAIRVRHKKNLFPVLQSRDNFEGLGELARFVSREQKTNLGINFL